MSAAAPPGFRRKERRGGAARQAVRAVMTGLIWLGGVACISPLLWAVVASFRPGQAFLVAPSNVNLAELTLSNYRAVFGNDSFLIGFKNSAIQVAIILATTIFFCPLAGYGFAKFTFRGKRFLFGVMALTLFFVPLTQYIPLLIEMNAIGWVDTYQALVMPQIISSLGIFWMSLVIQAIPNDMLHAARIDGCGNLGVWWRIVMPVIKPALVSLAVVAFINAYNDYFWPLLILQSPSMQTVQIALALIGGGGPVLAGCVIVVLPAVVIFLTIQRYFVRGLWQGSIEG